MIIGDKIKRLTFRLQVNGRPHHAEIISDMENAARLNAGKNAHEEWPDFPRTTEKVQPECNRTLAGRPASVLTDRRHYRTGLFVERHIPC